MSYPNKPVNRLIVGGVDLFEEFKMVLMDGYTLNPPTPKKYTIDIPGGNGVIDLTETVLGDVAYSMRQQTFSFVILNVNDFEKVKTKISNFLHGKYYRYIMTMDPDYFYEGRFEISSYAHETYTEGTVGIVDVKVEANPFKTKEPIVLNVNAAGGIQLNLESGRLPCIPKITNKKSITVICNDVIKELSRGTWEDEDFIFRNGFNKIFINSQDMFILTWGNLIDKTVTWGEFCQKPLFEWYRNDFDISAIDSDDPRIVKIEYEWGDL